ncbi:MAG: HWE histidine kinase domain-containing protein [Rhodomicrobium sp.]
MEVFFLSSVLLACAAAAVSSAITWRLAKRTRWTAPPHALALKESEERLRLANEAAGIGTFTIDLEAGEARYSPELSAILGFPHVAITKIELAMARVHRDDIAWVRSQFGAAAAGESGGRVKMDFRFVRPGGEVRWMTWLGRVLFRDEARGKAQVKMVGACLDITDRKRDEERIRFLMREVNHRSKNMLALAQAIARQIRATEPQNFLEQFDERIEALAVSQDLLVKSAWTGVDIGELVRFQLAHFGELIGTLIAIEGRPLTISAAAAQILGMAVRELAANAGKYGALSTMQGRILLAWSLEPNDEGEPTFSMSWRECEGPPVSPPAGHGFGVTVLCAGIENSLSAKVDLSFPADGLIWRFQCPAAEICDHG